MSVEEEQVRAWSYQETGEETHGSTHIRDTKRWSDLPKVRRRPTFIPTSPLPTIQGRNKLLSLVSSFAGSNKLRRDVVARIECSA